MAYNFNDEDKVEQEYAEKMPYGVSEVQLVTVEAAQTDAGKDYIEFTVVNPDGLEDTARIWFVGGAAKYSFNTARQILVHQGKDDAQKEEIRQKVENCASSDDLAELFQDFLGGKLWFTKYVDAERTWTTPEGEVRPSVNKSVYGYEPKLKPELMPKQAGNDPLAGAEDVSKTDAGAKVPDSWS